MSETFDKVARVVEIGMRIALEILRRSPDADTALKKITSLEDQLRADEARVDAMVDDLYSEEDQG